VKTTPPGDLGQKIGGAHKDRDIVRSPKDKAGKGGEPLNAGWWASDYRVARCQEPLEHFMLHNTRSRKQRPRIVDSIKEAIEHVACIKVRDYWRITRKLDGAHVIVPLVGKEAMDDLAIPETFRDVAQASAYALAHAIELMNQHPGNLGAMGEDLLTWRGTIPERVGPPAVIPTDRSEEETFIRAVGFRAVEFGAGVGKTAERQQFLQQVYESMCDLLFVTGVCSSKFLTMGDYLAVAFGSRGKGGSAAYYDPYRKCISLNRRNGAGHFAHEWAHALDHYLVADPQCSSLVEKAAANDMLLNPRIRCFLPEVQNLVAAISAPNFMKEAQRMDKTRRGASYWARADERFARCMTSYVSDTLEAAGRVNGMLAIPIMAANQSQLFKGFKPFPEGDERRRINEAYRNLFTKLSTLT